MNRYEAVKDATARNPQAIYGAPENQDKTHLIYTVPWRTDNHPSLKVRKRDGDWFDNPAGDSGDAIDYLERLGFDNPLEEAERRHGIKKSARVSERGADSKTNSMGKPTPPPTPVVNEKVDTSPAGLDAWTQADYGLPWSIYEQFGCTVADGDFGKNKYPSIFYPLKGPKGAGTKIRTIARLDPHEGRNKRLVKHGTGGAGFFPASLVGTTGRKVITAGEDKALASIYTEHAALSGSCGEGGINEALAQYAVAQGHTDLLVIMDGDDAGKKGAEAAAKMLHTAGALSVRIHTPPDGMDLNDYLQKYGKEALAAFIEEGWNQPTWTPTAPEWPEMQPLTTIAEPMPFPLECLERSEFREFVTALAHESEVPVDLVVTQAFPTIAAAIQASCYYDVTHLEHACIYAVGLAASGERKSPPERKLTAPFHAIYHEMVAEYSQTTKASAMEKRILKKRRALLENNAAKEQDEAKRRNLMAQLSELDSAETESPKPSPMVITEATCPGIKKKMMDDPRETLFITDTESRVVDIMLAGAYDNGGEPDSDILRKAYTADYCNGLRAGPDAVQGVIHKPTISMGLIIQTAQMEKFFKHSSNTYNGNLARFLFSWPKSMSGKRTFHGQRCPERLLGWWSAIIYDLYYKQPLPSDSGGRGWFKMGATPEAISAWREFIQAEEVKRDPQKGEYALHGEVMLTWAGKLEGHVIRIAMALHAILHGSDYVNTPITETTMRNAITITRYYIAHAMRVFTGYMVDPRNREAVRVFRLLSRKADNGVISLHDANRAGLNNDPHKRDDALELLESAGWIRRETVKSGARAGTLIHLNPAAVEVAQ